MTDIEMAFELTKAFIQADKLISVHASQIGHTPTPEEHAEYISKQINTVFNSVLANIDKALESQ